MKSLKYYIECQFATPVNVPGMGDVAAPEGDVVGSGDIPVGTVKPKRKKKKTKKHSFQ